MFDLMKSDISLNSVAFLNNSSNPPLKLFYTVSAVAWVIWDFYFISLFKPIYTGLDYTYSGYFNHSYFSILPLI